MVGLITKLDACKTSEPIYFIKAYTVTTKLPGTAPFEPSQSAVCKGLAFLLA
jgi:hypothetical protein